MSKYLYNFLPIYPDYDEKIENILGSNFVEDGNPNYNIYRKKEFYDYRLEKVEKKPEIGKYMNHQIIISRFLSSNTPYNGLLLMHQPGTGKTCSSVATVERIRNETNSYKRALIIMKGQNLINNYVNELALVCTCKEKDEKGQCIDGPYIPKDYELLNDEKRKRRINSLISNFYEFQTFQKFTDYIEKTSDDTLIKEFSDRIIVIDEAHNLRLSDKSDKDKDKYTQYDNMHRFLHIVKNCKVLLLTGTPMVDRPNEIASIMNLILPMERQIPTLDNFTSNFLLTDKKDKDLTIMNPKSVNKLKSYLHGYISYLVAMKSDVKKKYMGDFDINKFVLYSVIMKDIQQQSYIKAYLEDQKGKTGVYNDSIQSSLFVFPDGTYGSEGFKKYIKIEEQKASLMDESKKSKSVYKVRADFKKLFLNETDNEKKLKILSNYSSKYTDCIRKILENNGETHFVYIKLVEGSGAVIFSKLLEEFGFKDTKGSDGPGLRYSIITNATTTETETLNILKTFNSKSNMTGKYIKVIIGSEKMAEGITLKNIRNIHIVTPTWNFSEIDQAIARGYRLFSHNDLIENGFDVTVKIFLYCNLLEQKSTKDSIDYKMYKISQSKDISIKSIESVIKESSFDCALNRDRNSHNSSFDNKRECNYQNCNYSCDSISDDEYKIADKNIDIDTYNLYYNNEYVDDIIKDILEMMNRKNITFITLDEIKRDLKNNITDSTLSKVLSKMKNTNINLFSKFGQRIFLRYDNNMLYFTYNLKNNSDFLDTFYVSNFPLQKINKIEDKTTLLNKLPNLLDRLKKDLKVEHLNEFSIDIQELMLELSILSLRMKKELTKENKTFRDFITNHFKSYIIELDSKTIVSTLLKTNRCLRNTEPMEWHDCNDAEEKQIEEYIERQSKEKITLREKFGYYGIQDIDGKFKIADIKYEKKTKGKMGRKCSTWNVVELLNLIKNIKFDPKDDSYSKKLYKMSNDKLFKYYKEKIDGFESVQQAFGDKFESLSKEDKIRIMYWGRGKTEGTMNKTIICNALEKWFVVNNLFDIEVKEDKKVKKDKKDKVEIKDKEDGFISDEDE
jgi:hypothetical protein